MVSTVQASCTTQSSPFSGWDCPVSKLAEKAVEMAANPSIAKQVEKILKAQEKEDPALKSEDAKNPKFAEMVSEHNPYDFNRLCRGNPDVYVNASEVPSEVQDFILAACPKVPGQVTEIFMSILNGKASKRVWVSVLDSSEVPDLCKNFWCPDFVKTLPLRDGWKLSNEESTTTQIAKGKENTEIVKTTLVFRNGIKTIQVDHLQYNGWFNKSACPDEKLFMNLFEEMDTLNKQEDPKISSAEVPILINCSEGQGRSAATAISYIWFKRINEWSKDKRATLVLNILNELASLRKYRPGLMRNHAHVLALYAMFGKYYEKLLSQ